MAILSNSMDNHEPPVYRASYELTLAIVRFVKDCNPDYKMTLGAKLQSEVLNMSAVVHHINEHSEKREYIQKALNHCFYIRMILRLMLDTSIIKLDTSVALNLKIDEVAKQLSGWKKSL